MTLDRTRGLGYTRGAMRRLLLLPLLLALCTAPIACRGGTSDADLEAFAQRWRALFDSHDVAALAALYAPNGAYTTPGMVYLVRTPVELRKVLDTLWRSNPDMRISGVHNLVVQDDRIAFVWEMTLSPNAKPPRKRYGATFLTVRDGLIRDQLTVTSP